jgi:N-methylhydantoinase A
VISFDMGGTTAKLCLIEGGEPTVTDAFEVDKVGLKKGSGLPISVPSIDLIEIGAGGGSIARLSSVGLLSVGPESSGAHPGPACYGRGGTEPTVTDADVALGFVNPGFFAGGSILLDRKAALTAIRQLAEPLGMDTIEAAWAIHEVVNRNMIAAARAASVERGVDPRRFSLVAFGGAGPVHCGRLAEGLGVSRVIVPVGAGVMSAQGLLTAEVKFDLARTYRTMVEDDAVEPVARVYEELARMARTMLQQSVGQDQAGEAVFARAADVRYVGQGYELRVALPGGEFGSRSFTALNAEFHRTYEAVYGRSDPEWPIEAVNWRLEARLPARHERQKAHANHTVAEQKLKERRLVYVREAGGLVETPIYDRYALAPGDEVQGPTVIEERESTIVVIPSQTAYVHENGDLVLVTRMGD